VNSPHHLLVEGVGDDPFELGLHVLFFLGQNVFEGAGDILF